jgi:hypothetical protein
VALVGLFSFSLPCQPHYYLLRLWCQSYNPQYFPILLDTNPNIAYSLRIPFQYRGVSVQHLQTGSGGGGRGMTWQRRCAVTARRSKPRWSPVPRRGAERVLMAGTAGGLSETCGPSGLAFSTVGSSSNARKRDYRGPLRSKPKNTARGTPWVGRTCGLPAVARQSAGGYYGFRQASMSRGVEVRGSGWTLGVPRALGLFRERRLAGIPAYPGPSKKYGRRSVGCLTFESAVCGRNHNLRSFPRKRESSSSCAGSANIAKALDPRFRGGERLRRNARESGGRA